MRTLDASLSDVLGCPGTVGVLLVDAVSGLGYASAGDTGAIGTGGELAELSHDTFGALNELHPAHWSRQHLGSSTAS